MKYISVYGWAVEGERKAPVVFLGFDIGEELETGRLSSSSTMTPQAARELAKRLLIAADEAEEVKL